MSCSNVRLTLALAVFCVLVSAGSSVAAQTTYTEVKNDSFSDRQRGKIASAELISGEMYLATFEIPQSWTLPVELKGVRVVAVPGNKGPANQYCGRFTIEVFDEGTKPTNNVQMCPSLGGSSPTARAKDPGKVIYSMHNQFKGNMASRQYAFQVKGDKKHYQDLLFSTVNQQMGVTINPVMLNTRTVRVGIKAIDKGCPPMGGQYFPLMATDKDGTSGRNWLYGSINLMGTSFCNRTEHYRWADMASQLSTTPGDFILRLLFAKRGGGGDVGVDAGPDAGMDAGSMASDTGAQSSDAAPSDLVEVAPMDSSGGMDDDATSSGGLEVKSISPDEVGNDQETDVVILGDGFEQGLQVLVGAENIQVGEVLAQRIRATVPPGLDPGTYDVIVTNPGGESAVLKDGLSVNVPASIDTGTGGDVAAADAGTGSGAKSGGASDDGCGCHSTQKAPSPSAILWTILLLVTLRPLRRKS